MRHSVELENYPSIIPNTYCWQKSKFQIYIGATETANSCDSIQCWLDAKIALDLNPIIRVHQLQISDIELANIPGTQQHAGKGCSAGKRLIIGLNGFIIVQEKTIKLNLHFKKILIVWKGQHIESTEYMTIKPYFLEWVQVRRKQESNLPIFIFVQIFKHSQWLLEG